MAIMEYLEEGAARLAVWRIEESWDGMRLAAGGEALAHEAERHFGSPTRRMEWLAVRAALRQMAGDGLEIAYLPTGKPYLAGGGWHIGISHTRGYAAVILGKRPVSVDIEQYAQRVRRVRERFLRPDEEVRPYLGDDTWSLLLHWSAKEAVCKMTGDTSIDFLGQLRVFPFSPLSEGELCARELKSPLRLEYAVRYRLHPGFVMTWITASPVPSRWKAGGAA